MDQLEKKQIYFSYCLSITPFIIMIEGFLLGASFGNAVATLLIGIVINIYVSHRLFSCYLKFKSKSRLGKQLLIPAIISVSPWIYIPIVNIYRFFIGK